MARWRSGKRLDTEDALKIIIQVCYAVEFAHKNGVLHRDIKADNVMLGMFNEVYLMDWGVAVELSKLQTARRGIVGTTSYMAPEMVTGEPQALSTATDIYLLGALLHRVITGEVKHNANSLPLCLLNAYDSHPYKYPPEISEELAELCNSACHKDPQGSSIISEDI